VRKRPSIKALLQQADAGLEIGTSRYGSPINDVWSSVKASIGKASSILVLFGSPKQGLKEILRQQNLEVGDEFDYFVNMVPDQHTATVRTEEALFISLGLINFALAL
jgi:predicted SPOUT superfamily RNA methylase MTH1